MAEALVGGAFLSAFLQVAFGRLASSKILNYFQKRKLNVQLLRKLKITLLSINAVLDDAEEKEIRNQNVKEWVDEIKDAVFDAEDLLDEIDTEASQQELEAELTSGQKYSRCCIKVRHFSTLIASACVNSSNNEIESKIQEVLDHLEHLAKQMNVLGLKAGVGIAGKVSQRLPSTSLVDETQVYGRDDDKGAVMKLLHSDDVNGGRFSVIAILAMGGMGKTTLAQLVYNDERVKNHFEIKGWICVSEPFDVIDITKKILEELEISTNDSRNLNMLQLKLKDRLVGKKCLLVLDDVWNEDPTSWEALQKPFNNCGLGSKFLVTTRIESVAKVMHSYSIHHLKQLEKEYEWMLFAKHAFDDRDSAAYPNLEAIGKKIVFKCQGLPLAIKTLGGMLYTKSLEEEWVNILESNIWDFPNDIIPALRLSYHYLPSHLKQCFAYCSIFPKDHVFDKETLILMWMAQGFLQKSKNNKRMEEVGKEYFDDLVARSFFQVLDHQSSRFVMHDLMNDLANSISETFCNRLKKNFIGDISEKTRHLSLSKNYFDDDFASYEPVPMASRLRSFISIDRINHNISDNVISNPILQLKYMRALSLRGSYLTKLSDSIGNLKHLRYLNLSDTRIEELPDSICRLYNLQTFKLNRCSKFLGELPKDMHKLVNLRYFYFFKSFIKEVPYIGRLKHLQRLTNFEVGKRNGTDIKQLGQLNQLRGSLPILHLQNVIDPTDAMQAKLKEKEYLEEIALEWSAEKEESEKDRNVLEMLQPHKNLKKLRVINYGGTRFPDWIGDCSLLSNVIYLELNDCKYCFSLPPLGQLLSLKELKISNFDALVAIGTEFYFQGNAYGSFSNNNTTQPFRSLEILSFEYMKSWEEWCCWFEGENVAAVVVFPCLKEFYVWNCPKLKGHLPQQLPSLKILKIWNCQQLLASLPSAPNMCELNLASCEEMSLIDVPSFPFLKKVSIHGSRVTESLLKKEEVLLTNTTCLEQLRIYASDIPSLQWPDCHYMQNHYFNSLGYLRIQDCNSLLSLSLDLFPMLTSLELVNCHNLESLSASLPSSGSESDSEGQQYITTSLSELEISKCPKFVSLSLVGAGGSSLNLNAPKLRYLKLDNLDNLKSLPQPMHNLLPSLYNLFLSHCPQLESFPEQALPLNLNTLSIYNCPKLLLNPFCRE
ncbi:Disease resistance protein [Quillaja saponaria]|uniref:Disease resistance protein n=1 Tax=Quillaja saponaria TaxID=32244 RepID=A0AAD7PC01_QUISA|nr:Disease resistance protein [Quillaja saponaria]